MLSIKRSQCGASLIELMVSMVVGLMVLAGVSALFVDYISSNRSTLLMARLNQELGAAMDLVVRDVRRAGYWKNAINGVWYSGSTGVQSNPYAAITQTTTEIDYSASKDVTENEIIDTNDAFGFKLDHDTNALQMLRNGDWDDITDPSSTEITAFSITPTSRTIDLTPYCISTPGGSAPTMVIRFYEISISARSKADSSITRQITESVRVRNDNLSGSC